MSAPTEPRAFRRDASAGNNTDNALANAPRGPRGPRDPKSMRPSGSHRPLHAPEGGSNKANLKRIRDIKRLLAKADIPATVRADLEKELQSRHEKKGEKKLSARRSTMISRYHMVRFFERKKAERRLKKAQKALATTDDEAEKARLQEQERVLNIDIAYTQYHPHLEPYVSLYPNNINDGKKNKKQDEQDEEEENPDDPMNKPDMWHVIEEAMKEGTLALEKIRDRKNAAAFLQAPLVINSRPKEESAAERKQDRGPPREKGRKKDVQRSGHWQEATGPEEEDDGEGFFE